MPSFGSLTGMECRFKLLMHIRLARGFLDLQQRRMAVQARLLAFHVLFQSSLNQDNQLYAADNEFVPELMGLLAEVSFQSHASRLGKDTCHRRANGSGIGAIVAVRSM